MSGEHLISDDETRQITEGFLTASPWLGDAEWEEIVIGPNAAFLAELHDGSFPADAPLLDGQKWSWKVSFSDPVGGERVLSHEAVLKGLSNIVYGDHSGPEAWGYLRIQQWFTEPTEARRSLELSPSDQSRICQHALYGKVVFRTEDEKNMFGKGVDLFEEKRPTPTDNQTP